MSIQVEMPKWIAKDEDGNWYAYTTKPKLNVFMFFIWWGYNYDRIPINVIGFDGDWKDSLHQFVDGKWIKV